MDAFRGGCADVGIDDFLGGGICGSGLDACGACSEMFIKVGSEEVWLVLREGVALFALCI